MGNAKRRAQKAGDTERAGRLLPMSVEKSPELAEDDPKIKFTGRVVFDGRLIRGQDKRVELFQDLSSCPATAQAGNAADCRGCLPGHVARQADAGQA